MPVFTARVSPTACSIVLIVPDTIVLLLKGWTTVSSTVRPVQNPAVIRLILANSSPTPNAAHKMKMANTIFANTGIVRPVYCLTTEFNGGI